jgi:O-antigen/teichoic acid export membrane protein
MSRTTEDIQARRRNRSIGLAVATSFLSKGGNVLLQLLSIPIAVRVLGREEYGLFATVNLSLSLVTLLQVGVGPALTHGLAKARADGDETGQRELGSTAFFLMTGLAALAGVVLAAVLCFVPLTTLYGETVAGRESVLRPALWTCLGLFLLLFVLNLTDRVREGHLEVASNNLWGAVGNVTAALFVGVGVWFVPQVWFLVLAVHGAMVLAKLGNTAALWRRHRLMRPDPAAFRGERARHLFSDGVAFSTCFVVAGIIEYNFCGWLVNRIHGLADIALYNVLISLTVMQLGFVVMLSAPTWPAVAEALARGDRPWAKRAARRLHLYGAAFALCSATGLVLLGPWLLPLWLGKEFSLIDRTFLACYGLYFIAHVWRHLNHALMVGTGQVSKVVGIQLAESALIAALAAPVLSHWGIGGLLVMMGTVILLLTGTVLPWKVRRAL